MLFLFDTGEAIDVSYFVNSTFRAGPYACCHQPSGVGFITGYGVGGSDLGTVMVSGVFDHFVSSLFGDVPLSGFKVSGDPSIDVTGFRIGALTFTAVPEPSTALLLGMGLVAMSASKRRMG